MLAAAADKAQGGVTQDLGATLRTAREICNLSVHKAAQSLHLGDRIIEALEGGDYATLGASIFVRGHLRNYARLLGLREEDVLTVYEHSTQGLAAPPLVTQRQGRGRTFVRRFGFPVFTVAIASSLVVMAALWWAHHITVPQGRPVTTQRRGVLAQPMGTALPDAQTRPTALPALQDHRGTAGPPRLGIAPLEAEASGKHLSAVVGRSGPGARSVAIGPMQTSRSQAAVRGPAGAALTSGVTHAQFTVRQASWIEVYDAAGKRLFYDLAPAGDTFDVSGTPPLQVFLGNSPGVRIESNGVPFNQAPFTQPDNTARFRLGANPKGLRQSG